MEIEERLGVFFFSFFQVLLNRSAFFCFFARFGCLSVRMSTLRSGLFLNCKEMGAANLISLSLSLSLYLHVFLRLGHSPSPPQLSSSFVSLRFFFFFSPLT
jgi:hypothetical protein